MNDLIETGADDDVTQSPCILFDGTQIAIAYIVSYRLVEEHGVLRNDSDVLPERRKASVAYILSQSRCTTNGGKLLVRSCNISKQVVVSKTDLSLDLN